MQQKDKVHLTFIPPEYWNTQLSEFNIVQKNKSLPKGSSFFLLWNNQIKKESALNTAVKNNFPSIPANRLFTCNINLAHLNRKTKEIKISRVIGKLMPIGPTLNLLFGIEIRQGNDRLAKFNRYSASIKTYTFIIKLIFELLNRGCFIPTITGDTNEFKCNWKLILKTPLDYKRFNNIVKYCPWQTHNLPINFIENSKNSYTTKGLWHPSYLFSNFMDKVGDYLIRSILKESNFQTFQDFYRPEIQKEKSRDESLKWDYKFIKGLLFPNSSYKISEFFETIIPSIIQNWVQSIQAITFNKGFTISFELKYPKDAESDWILKLWVISQEFRIKTPITKFINEKNKEKERILKFFINEAAFLEYILRALGTAANIFKPLQKSFQGPIPEQISLTTSEVMDFLKYPKYLLVQSGFNVDLPDVFNQGGRQRLSARLVIKKDEKPFRGVGGSIPSLFQLSSLVSFKWEATLEGKELSEEEFSKLIDSKETLVNLGENWVLIDPQDIEDLRTIFNQSIKEQALMSPSGEISYMDALKLGLSGNVQLRDGGTKYEIVVEGDLNEIINRIQYIDSFKEIPTPKAFNGKLRPYQQTAITWMANMCDLNFGICLADDMGLGKTIQVIAYLLYRKKKYPRAPGSILVICPTSVMFNWIREIKKFAPDLDVILHHGPKRIKDLKKASEYTKSNVIILTSYGTLRNDIDFLESIHFEGVIVDESQNMKNYESQQTKAILKLKSGYRICLSGTPIENRLMELWTLFEFLNPGLLGKRSDFQRNYVMPIERFQDQDAADKLRRIIAPFIMRRVKSDKNIIDDLPDKNEMKIYLNLSKEQVKLYKTLVDRTLEEMSIISTDKRRKRGLVLGLLTKLKQVCNHPFQFNKQKIDDTISTKEIISKSKKLERLLEMIEEVISNGEKVLIFTQFKQMGDLILKTLERIYDFSILFFHGSISATKRKEIVDEFQSENLDSSPVLIVSLKAGGTGLNLTKGTTVIHFDRWWNPAVEDQATDRAYRIGQTKEVNVYKFITLGTIEEKIDSLLVEKRDLADKIVVSTGESWISDLSEDKLRELLELELE
ncbi:MAG: DEAD/DEAH box helicase [Promethearchaeota archaeon]